MPSDTMRLDKLLRTLGLGTRSQVQALVRAGRVAVDGQAARDPGLLLNPPSRP
ncbi:MAG TPA: S4 domain-containing protein [Clostridia bacterium]|nr:S4 domain-containing protein [Clostridia bacterium]